MEARMGDGGMKGGMEACREGWGNGERETGKGGWLGMVICLGFGLWDVSGMHCESY